MKMKNLLILLILIIQYINNILCINIISNTTTTTTTTTNIYRNLNDYITDIHDAKHWCEYLQKTPEPDIILYNRLAKCGSTTIKMLFSTLSSKNNFVSHSVDKIYWRDLDLDKKLRTNFLTEINDIMSSNDKLVVDGHWFHTEFSNNELKGVSFENIQLLRECKSRKHSKFFYGLFDSSDAVHAKSLGDKAYEKFKHEYIRSDISVNACLKDYDCIKGTRKFDRSDLEIRALCGSTCKDLNLGDDINGAYKNTHDPNSFTIIGSLEKFPEFLEMLECAYPTILENIKDLYVKDQTHGMEGSHNSVYSPAMTKILNEACDPSFNGYVDLYDNLIKLFDDRYKYMVENRNSCCRVKK